MTSLTLAVARQDIRDALAANFTQDAVEGSIPSGSQIRRINGDVYPYIVYRFPDVLTSADTAFAGPQGDSYIQPVFFLAVGPSVQSSQNLYMKIMSVFLGFQPSYSGMMTKRAGGGTYEVGVDNGATEVFISPANFAFTTVIQAIP